MTKIMVNAKTARTSFGSVAMDVWRNCRDGLDEMELSAIQSGLNKLVMHDIFTAVHKALGNKLERKNFSVEQVEIAVKAALASEKFAKFGIVAENFAAYVKAEKADSRKIANRVKEWLLVELAAETPLKDLAALTVDELHGMLFPE